MVGVVGSIPIAPTICSPCGPALKFQWRAFVLLRELTHEQQNERHVDT
jgi:hypothetical protein